MIPTFPAPLKNPTGKPAHGASIAMYSDMGILVIFCAGEDDVSFARHVKALQAEHKKQHPNPQIVEELMSCSFAQRRADILDKSYDLSALFEKYPFLNEVEQVNYCCG